MHRLLMFDFLDFKLQPAFLIPLKASKLSEPKIPFQINDLPTSKCLSVCNFEAKVPVCVQKVAFCVQSKVPVDVRQGALPCVTR